MAFYSVSDGALTSLANAIRNRGSTTASLSFPNGFVNAINAINLGVVRELIEGTLTSYTSPASVLCSGAFAYCSALSYVSFSLCKTINSQAFYRCEALVSISFPLCEFIGYGAFQGCYSLKSVYFPKCKTIQAYAFTGCHFEYASLPLCETFESCVFQECTSLKTIELPKCKAISSEMFYTCSRLSNASFAVCSAITGTWNFRGCFNLIRLYLMSTSLVTLANSSAFGYTPIDGYTETTNGILGSIYVRASLLSSYKSATNWTYFSSRFVGV